jgi:hypothetical protein
MSIELNEEDQLFAEALARKYHVEGNSKLKLLYSLAYERGHSGGDSEIENQFADFVDLIR